jgi:hypothetical protein
MSNQTLYRRSKSRATRWYIYKKLGYILEGLGMENVDIFNGHLEYFTAT